VQEIGNKSVPDSCCNPEHEVKVCQDQAEGESSGSSEALYTKVSMY